MKRIVKAASEKHIVVNALRVSAVVGTLVNLINQGGAIDVRTSTFLDPRDAELFDAVPRSQLQRGKKRSWCGAKGRSDPWPRQDNGLSPALFGAGALRFL